MQKIHQARIKNDEKQQEKSSNKDEKHWGVWTESVCNFQSEVKGVIFGFLIRKKTDLRRPSIIEIPD